MGKIARVRRVYIDTDKAALDQCGEEPTILIGIGNRQASAKKVEALSLAQVDEIRAMLGGFGLAVLVAGIGGIAGSTLLPIVANLARRSGQHIVAVVTMPFEFEGLLWAHISASLLLSQINSHLTLIISNETIRCQHA